jgi:LPS sulfotransferase NodH
VLEALRPHADAFVDCTSRAGIPQKLWPATKRIDGTILREGWLFNDYYPSPEIHREAADRLVPACQRLIERSKSFGTMVNKLAKAAPLIERFVILGAERSGTSLVRELLATHAQVYAGGEIFNSEIIRRGEIPWRLSFDFSARNQELNGLRESNPPAFFDALFQLAKTRAVRAIGFKLMYNHADKDARVRNFIAEDRTFRIIHVKRRNLLRRFLSLRRALQTGRWWVKTSEPAPESPRVTLTPEACLADFALIEGSWAKYDELFKSHHVLEMYYEDICADLRGARSRMLRFLGLSEAGLLKVDSQKTGTDSLRDAIEDYKELRAALHEYAKFFDD